MEPTILNKQLTFRPVYQIQPQSSSQPMLSTKNVIKWKSTNYQQNDIKNIQSH